MNSLLVTYILQTEKWTSPELFETKNRIYPFLNPVSYLIALENKSLFDLAKEAIYTKEFESLSETDKIKALESVRKPVFLNFDISEEKIPTPSKDDVGVLTREELERISAAMAEMNEEGRERAVEMVEDLAAGGRFKKHCSDAMDKEA